MVFLTESHKIERWFTAVLQFYDPVYCAFAFNTIANDPQDLVVYAKRFRPFYFGAKPILGESLYLKECCVTR
jgi:hypothetical protein